MRRLAASVIFLVLFSASLSFAQAVPASAGAGVPPVIRFSGTLAVPPGRVPVTFGLYREEGGGEPLWVETQTVAVDAAGRYAVVLGATTALSPELFVNGEARWLDVTVEGHDPRPRVLLVSVPYALKAADADTVGGKPVSAFVLAGEKTGVGANGLTYVDTKVLATGLTESGAPGGAGLPNYIGMFTDATTLGNSVVYQTPGGSIGVNTVTPLAGFHAVSGASPVAYYDVYSNALGALPVVYRAARGTPSAPSAVQSNDILGGLAVRGYGATGFSQGRGQVMFKAAENWTDSANGTYLQFTTTPLGGTSWEERIRVTPDGNVGIGTSIPAQRLSVAGTIESTAGGFRFPDGTTQATAGAAYTAGAGLSLAGNAFSVTFGGTGAANAAARSDHQHDGAYVALGGSYNNPVWLTGLAATKISGSLPVAQIAGAASLGANTFAATQTINGGNLALPVTTSMTSGVLTLGGQTFLHGYGATTYANTYLGAQAGSFATSGVGGNVGVGWQALQSNTTGGSNTAGGRSALAGNTTGSYNTASGALALYSNTTGSNNTASGWSALWSNSTGLRNTANGSAALGGNTTGESNTASGYQALLSNTTGNYNTANGALALLVNTTGSGNTASGVQALLSNTTGLNNTATGVQTLQYNTTGSNNTASGVQALWSNSTGFRNTASGALALWSNTTGLDNTASGAQSLQNNTTGSGNTASGVQALAANTTASDNTASGYQALAANTTGSQNTGTGSHALLANTTGSDNTASGHGTLAANTTGWNNTASGAWALSGNTTGANNTGTGYQALYANTTGNSNTATGGSALFSNTEGHDNTATGTAALMWNTTGTYNAATGALALHSNTTGSNNTATGASALPYNTTGSWNTANGTWALGANTSGDYNTATGFDALGANTTASYNTTSGYQALSANTTGPGNTAIGAWALSGNTTGSGNTAIGEQALESNSTGNYNIGIGMSAGGNLGIGSYNIDIGSGGIAGEGNTIRIGISGNQTRAFIAGIRGVTTGSANAVAVLIDSNGQLGTASSSRRVKDDIADMASASSGLMKLRPVTFHYKSDQNPAGRTLQYGLIAEEVAEVYPGLVAHSADGQIETVMYQFLPPMLLNEVQKQQRTIDALRARLESADARIRTLTEQMRARDAQTAALTQAVAALRDKKQ
jgi:hypothetical protein